MEAAAAEAATEEERRKKTQLDLQDRFKLDLEREKMVNTRSRFIFGLLPSFKCGSVLPGRTSVKMMLTHLRACVSDS